MQLLLVRPDAWVGTLKGPFCPNIEHGKRFMSVHLPRMDCNCSFQRQFRINGLIRKSFKCDLVFKRNYG